jgi:hypothetical protein
MWILQCYFLYAKPQDFTDTAVIIMMNRHALRSEFFPVYV